ncbi:gluconokinase [Maribacter sp. HTCC2170]|uniref:gluconokinase n=1 Tax=Maribacter sp. (strain HTCC2170 / KCCM 42371) TaxID=313603 RepID=UPI00006B21E6|nr:gluconokinase [Maribacter sp. HTCC2170]EAR00406.1 putative D-gluconate kinase active at low temperature (idonate catabolism) [Maribacter sp. HTCC2170]
MNKSVVFVVMGVSGCGKSTIGTLLSKKLDIPFFDGDDFHPDANVKKMKNGLALDDIDREGWLKTLNKLAVEHKEKGAVIACSALKESYRAILKQDLKDQMVFVHLEGSFDEIHSRLKKRKGHYMPIELLKSQFETLEIPKNAIHISILESPEVIISKILN